ncbi:MAG: DegQ family serine endoprotease [Deltaproteobacteria bacterium]|nr:DegQ family serine endoprotease [Deltaproteobacteria bacterium]
MSTNQKHPFKKLTIVFGTLLCLLVGFSAITFVGPLPESQAQTSGLLPSAPESFAPLVKKASPSVVYISTVKTVKGPGQIPFPFGPDSPFGDFFDRYFRDQIPRDFKQEALGTGFIIDKEGYILTNNHVVEKSDDIKVKLADGKEYEADIIGKDPKTDLALIKINPDQELTALPLGNSDEPEVGDWVVAIGNPFGLGNTVTAGIVSAKYRNIGAGAYDNFIQTDASINPGNSGGPLLNTKGEVIGINTLIYSQSGGNIGIGFAIPINMVKDLLPQLKEGKIVRGWLGVIIQEITSELKEKLDLKDENGALVADVPTGGPAEEAGIQRGDVIVSFDGQEIKSSKELPYLVASTPVGKTVTVEVVRDGKKISVKVKIGELKEGESGYPSAEEDKTAKLGMVVQEITPELARNFGLSEKSGLVVVQVDNGSPAAEAGIRSGDIILEVDRVTVKNLDDFNQKLGSYKAGDAILFLVKQQGNTFFLTVKVPK